jgi:mannose-6-phosphate isomerase-like protein (cupin superfamily)
VERFDVVMIYGGPLLDKGDSPCARIDKPWGTEILWARREGYAAKLLRIEAGHRLSLQHHARKEETLLVLQGQVSALLEDDAGRMHSLELGPGEGMHVPPGRRHRLESAGGALLVEVSSPELQDVIRHADDYGRTS